MCGGQTTQHAAHLHFTPARRQHPLQCLHSTDLDQAPPASASPPHATYQLHAAAARSRNYYYYVLLYIVTFLSTTTTTTTTATTSRTCTEVSGVENIGQCGRLRQLELAFGRTLI